MAEIIRVCTSFLLFILAILFATIGQYDRALFYLAVAAMIAPDVWLTARRGVK